MVGTGMDGGPGQGLRGSLPSKPAFFATWGLVCAVLGGGGGGGREYTGTHFQENRVQVTEGLAFLQGFGTGAGTDQTPQTPASFLNKQQRRHHCRWPREIFVQLREPGHGSSRAKVRHSSRQTCYYWIPKRKGVAYLLPPSSSPLPELRRERQEDEEFPSKLFSFFKMRSKFTRSKPPTTSA